MSSNSPDSSSTFGSELLAGLLGAGIAIGCVLPPVVHLVTGPLGPLLGGFVAANRARPGARGTFVIAVLVGTGVAGILGLAAALLVSLAGRTQLPDWFPSTAMLVAVLLGVWLYGATLAAVGALVSGVFGRKDS